MPLEHVPRRPGSASFLPASLQLIYDKKSVSWEVQDVELALSQAAALPNPGNACREETKNGQLLAHAFWLCPDTNSNVNVRISLDPTD